MDRKEIIDAFMFRHACKEFDPGRKVSDSDFELIMEAGRLSPSSFGIEPWQFLVLQNMRVRERLVPVTWGARRSLTTASHYVLILARTKAGLLPESEYIQGMLREVHRMPADIADRVTETYRNFLVNDFKLIDNERAMFDWACKQAYIALGNMMTVAALVGVDSCPIEGYDQDEVERILREEGVLAEDELGLACMVAFGYRVKEPRPKSRQSAERVVQWVE